MPNFILTFDASPLENLDQLALLACQDYNYGNSTQWFGSFRGGLYGLYSRLNAVQQHYYDLHAWIPVPRVVLVDAEYHLANLFFNMDSAIECMTFALNALGNCVARTEFRDITDENSLRKINPSNILGEPSRTPPLDPLVGYANCFPSLQAHWQNNRSLIQQIFDQHNVSKHRETIFRGGRVRDDVPPGFYESIGITNEDQRRGMFHPMVEIILRRDPKCPRASRVPTPYVDQLRLEPLVDSFAEFMNESAHRALADAKANIPLTHTSFLRQDGMPS